MPVIQIVQKHQQRRPLGKSPNLPDLGRISPLAGERDSSQGGSSVASTIHGQHSTLSSSRNNSGEADISRGMTSTLSTTQRPLINPSTAMPGTRYCSTPVPVAISQADSMRPIASRITSGIASTATPLSDLENLPTPIPNSPAHVTITNQWHRRATERNLRQRQWVLQPPAVSTTRLVVSCSHRIQQSSQWDMMQPIFATDGFSWVQVTWR
jgi:hypothetical protein